MAQPPAAVARVYKPAGQLQLHRLSKRAGFHCVRCRKDKTDNFVATTNGDWAQTVCSDCYALLTPAQRREAKEAKKPANAQPRPAQAKQPSAKATRKEKLKRKEQVKRKEQEEKLKLAVKRERQLRRQLPGVDRLFAFFRAAGVSVEVGRQGALWINGSQTRPLRWILSSPQTLDWDNVIDEMALKHVSDKFIKAVADNARFGEGLRAFLRPRERGFAIMRDDFRLAMIHATHANIRHREVIHANFLKAGSHWQKVADVLHGAEAELGAKRKHVQEAKPVAKATAAVAEAERRRVVARRRIDHLPSGLDPALIAACLDASRRIRLDRQVAYERPVVLECDLGELMLLPIAGTITRLVAPFQLNKGTETVKGELLLGDHDPLPVLMSEEVAQEDTIAAWTCALLGLAAATCIELQSAEPVARRAPTRPSPHSPLSVPHHRPTQTVPRKSPWPGHLEPVGSWTQYKGSFVAGHRRHLHDGQTASDEARDWARQVGIILRPSETWVRPHTRGVPAGIEMRFVWHTPAELNSYTDR